MNRISEVTRRDIMDVFTEGITLYEDIIEYDMYERQIVSSIGHNEKMPYWGRLDEINFLKRLYDIKNMPSSDSRLRDAETDIIRHTVANDDWDTDWVFNDERFGLIDGDDKIFLNFICEVFHPAVRNEKAPWKAFYSHIARLLNADGYELYEKEYISGRPVFGWRDYQSKNQVLSSQCDSISKNFESEYVTTQIALMNDLIYSAPHSAIGKAKELLETCCKTILDEQHIEYSATLDLNQLMRVACDSINLTPKKVHKDATGKEIADKILGNLANIAQGMSELRNLYGDGHGKNKDFQPLPPRYANLAVGTAVATVNFMWDTYIERQKGQSKK